MTQNLHNIACNDSKHENRNYVNLALFAFSLGVTVVNGEFRIAEHASVAVFLSRDPMMSVVYSSIIFAACDWPLVAYAHRK
jgi:hypothetical protein